METKSYTTSPAERLLLAHPRLWDARYARRFQGLLQRHTGKLDHTADRAALDRLWASGKYPLIMLETIRSCRKELGVQRSVEKGYQERLRLRREQRDRNRRWQEERIHDHD